MATKITKKNEQTDKDKELKRVANRVDNLSNIFDVIQRENDATFADLQKRVHKLEDKQVSSSNSSDSKKDIDDITESLFPFVVKCICIFGIIAGSFAVLGSIVQGILSMFV